MFGGWEEGVSSKWKGTTGGTVRPAAPWPAPRAPPSAGNSGVSTSPRARTTRPPAGQHRDQTGRHPPAPRERTGRVGHAPRNEEKRKVGKKRGKKEFRINDRRKRNDGRSRGRDGSRRVASKETREAEAKIAAASEEHCTMRSRSAGPAQQADWASPSSTPHQERRRPSDTR